MSSCNCYARRLRVLPLLFSPWHRLDVPVPPPARKPLSLAASARLPWIPAHVGNGMRDVTVEVRRRRPPLQRRAFFSNLGAPFASSIPCATSFSS
ncbi:hypothetical protein GUJ93_ZPchr0014g46757 [Zizania palustris]|uniref:Uncharacterized protein n=1 Tax=Zizania palustris TaxID=103762 RepID=A0A8J5W0S2_ZIZPA|nr:hypothetical protein GUJ93_ZPchr0014g46757 [Zizania palustris]